VLKKVVMRISKIAKIQSGYISRGKIERREDGTHFLLQARDVNAERLTYKADNLVRFSPDLSRKDWVLKPDDVLFMARGTRNYSVLIKEIPEPALAAACFFIVRVSSDQVLPHYLCWYLNQAPVDHYLGRHSGRGVHMPVVRRSVIEGIEIPIPPLEVQSKISKMDVLLKKELELIDKLAEKRKELITAACLHAVRNNS
jgi:type I restriction modification DNA specificity protein